MQRFAPYLIKLDQDHTARFIAAARKALVHPWYHHRSKPGLEQEFIHFRRQAIHGCPPVILSLFREDSETLKVSNIVPRERSLSIDQWRAILIDFESSVLHKIRAPGLVFLTFMGSEDVNLADRMHPVAWKLLRSFAALAPKHRHGLHPVDRIHFLQFIAVLHFTRHTLDPHDFAGWLREQNFDSNLSLTLQDEFDYHLQLLKIYDQIRKSKQAKQPQP